MPQRGPKRLEYIPEKYRGVRGIEHLTTQDQLRKLGEYIANIKREPFRRLGCSTPQRPSVLLRQAWKKMKPMFHDSSAKILYSDLQKPDDRDDEAIKEYMEKIVEIGGNNRINKTSRSTLVRVASAENSPGTQNSTWIVCLDGEFEVIHKPSMDPRSAHKWMSGVGRAWNLAARS